MSDLFQSAVPDDYITAVARVMEIANWHTYQVLTKRSGRMRQMLNGKLKSAAGLRHVWWGVSFENRRYGLPRLADLKAAEVRVRFVSIEPLLEDLGVIDLSGVDWVIVGGESGPGARPMREEWVQQILEQCRAAKVPFFFKQWGGRIRKANGRALNGKTYDELPPRLALPVPERRQRLELASLVTY
jgi:protein gp37